MLFLILVLVVSTFVVMWNFDLHRAVILKMKVRDAGDAAALASARWQGIALNTLGELNLIQAAILTEYANGEDPLAVAAQVNTLHGLRQRVILNTPVLSFAAAQQAAFNNGIYANPSYQGMYQEWLDEYGSLFDPEFIDFFQAVVDNGVAAMTIYPYSTSYHPLADRSFYEAIQAAHDGNWWCLFQRDPDFMDYLQSYSSHDSWPDLPSDWGYPLLPYSYAWEQYGSIGSTNIVDFYNNPEKLNELQETVDSFGQVQGDINIGSIQNLSRVYNYYTYGAGTLAWVHWATYGAEWQGSWNDDIAENELQIGDTDRPIIDEYDYLAGQSVYRISADFFSRFGKDMYISGLGRNAMRDRSQRMEWSSAAKVFGSLDPGGKKPSYFGLVLPAFRDVRLVPVPKSAERVYTKGMDDYLRNGISTWDYDGDGIADYGGMYGQMLIYFDDPDFRQRGLDWLAEHSDECAESGFSEYDDVSDKEKGPPYGH